MLALAMVVVDEIVRKKLESLYFNGLPFTVPHYNHAGPQYHSIMGQKLLLVDWMKTHGLSSCPCPDASCAGSLSNDRTNFSKNKVLFPIFGIDAPPSWCVVMSSMVCGSCKRLFDANDGEVLFSLPAYAAATYPVETNYAQSNNI